MSLHRRLPYAVEPLEGESLLSWVGRLAAEYRMSRSAFLRAVGVQSAGSGDLSTRQGLVALSEGRALALEAATGVAVERVRNMQIGRFAGTLLPAGCTTRTSVSAGWLRRRFFEPALSRVCPRCAREDGVERLSWHFQLEFACVRHACVLQRPDGWRPDIAGALGRVELVDGRFEGGSATASEHVVELQRMVSERLASLDGEEAAHFAASRLAGLVTLVMLVAPGCDRGVVGGEVADAFDRLVAWRELGVQVVERALTGIRMPLRELLLGVASPAVVTGAMSMAVPMWEASNEEVAVERFVDLVNRGPHPRLRWCRLFDEFHEGMAGVGNESRRRLSDAVLRTLGPCSTEMVLQMEAWERFEALRRRIAEGNRALSET